MQTEASGTVGLQQYQHNNVLILPSSASHDVPKDKNTRKEPYSIDLSQKAQALQREHETKQETLEQSHEIKKQQIEAEYNQKRQQLEQEYKQKERSMGLSLYV